MSDEPKRIRCTRCAYEPTAEELRGRLTKCPQCGTTGIPCNVEDDVTVEINWHELHILGVWAENWAGGTRKDDVAPNEDPQRLVNILCGRLQAQHPERPPLTMSGDLAQLRQSEFGEGMEVRGFHEDEEANPPEERQ